VYLSGILHGCLWNAVDQSLPAVERVTAPVDVIAAAIGQHAPDGRVIEVDVEVRGDLAALGHVEESQAHKEGLHLEAGRAGGGRGGGMG